MMISTLWTTILFMAMPMATFAQPEAVSKSLEMVVTANPLATLAGEKILQAGGSAVDAMVAIQNVLGLLEPQSSGLGGGAFVVYFDAKQNSTTTFDARETAPAAATEDRFAGLDFIAAAQSGLSVGVPGTPMLMEHMHKKYGKLEWSTLFDDAKDLAENGFEVTGRIESTTQGLLLLGGALGGDCVNRVLFRDPVAFEYFVDAETCSAKPQGTVLTNLDYAATLMTLAESGAKGFYEGAIAQAIVDAVQNDLAIPGDMTLEDLANYKVIERDPVCIEYRGKNVCGMGPPSSGALAVGQILGILENFDISAIGNPLDVQAVHLFTQANRLAFADRGKYVGDSDFVDVPVAGMLNKTYLQSRAALINETGSDMGVVEPGVPPGVASQESGADTRAKTTGTSHVSIVDRCGNSLSMTTTVEGPYGNGVMVKGFLINNQLTDFSFAANDADGNPIANRVQPNKRPRSSMSPSIVFNENGLPELLTGSPGGSSIIGYTAQSIYNVFDFGLNPQEAINVPHYQNNNAMVTSLEVPKPGVTVEYNITELTEELEARGHEVAEVDHTSGLSVILISEDGSMVGGADGRREGTVGGSNSMDGGDDVSMCQVFTNIPISMPTIKPEDAGSSSSIRKLTVVASALIMLFALLLL